MEIKVAQQEILSGYNTIIDGYFNIELKIVRIKPWKTESNTTVII